ncbi:MAG: hypothetical protein J7K13_02465, partial [Thermoplasmata archaeon]|nr:hypothetical protein [Thermoplasmata archaeon]
MKTGGHKLIIVMMICMLLSPMVFSEGIQIKGFDRGVSWKPVVPLKKVTFVGFDEDGFLDDYAYLAAVPTSVFSDGSRLFSYPLLFYQDSYSVSEDRERSLNARQGIDYFMEDWMGYCNGRLDGMTLINVPKDKVKQWPSRNTTLINGDNPYDIASQIALHDWSYSDAAVVAVINESFTPLNIETHGEIKGVIPSGYTVKEMSFNMKQPNIGVGGCYQEFEIKEPYKYIVANMDWKNPAIDLDLQIYDDQLGMTDASSKWNIFYGAGETVGSYVYHHGIWEIGVTYMPTQYLVDGKMKSMFQNVDDTKGLSSILGLKRGETVEVKLYPGVIVDLNKTIPFDCRDVEFKLKWNNPSISLGMAILDPSGVETITSPSKDEIIEGINLSGTERVIHLDKLGETTDGENY